MHKFQLITAFFLFISAAATYADSGADNLYEQALAKYEARQYELALKKIQVAVELAPDESRYHHLLGKCYGRIAENSNPLKAFTLSKKTRMALEKAVELDEYNISALKDLMKYYRLAPVFLGGSKKKADKIEQLLEEIEVTAG